MYLILLAVFVVANFYWINNFLRKRIIKTSPSRKELADSDIYLEFFSHSDCEESDVIMLWHEIANTLKFSAGKLRPTDEFGKDIGAGIITTEELDVLFVLGKKHAKEIGREVNFQNIKTVRDYIYALSRKRPVQ